MPHGTRRARTEALCKHRLRLHRQICHHPSTSMRNPYIVTCWCERPGGLHRLSKQTPWTHNCRKSVRGNPKIGGGICHIGAWNPAVKGRQLNRALRLAIRGPEFDPWEVG